MEPGQGAAGEQAHAAQVGLAPACLPGVFSFFRNCKHFLALCRKCKAVTNEISEPRFLFSGAQLGLQHTPDLTEGARRELGWSQWTTKRVGPHTRSTEAFLPSRRLLHRN